MSKLFCSQCLMPKMQTSEVKPWHTLVVVDHHLLMSCEGGPLCPCLLSPPLVRLQENTRLLLEDMQAHACTPIAVSENCRRLRWGLNVLLPNSPHCFCANSWNIHPAGSLPTHLIGPASSWITSSPSSGTSSGEYCIRFKFACLRAICFCYHLSRGNGRPGNAWPMAMLPASSSTWCMPL